MRRLPLLTQLFLYAFVLLSFTASSQDKNLKLVFIRHAERPEEGNNLTCKGFNRSIQLPAVLYKKFGRPSDIYVPAINLGKKTSRARMFQTITPFAVKYNLTINSAYEEGDYKHISKALLKEKGTVIIVWEHKDIQQLVNALGVKSVTQKWGTNDYDSIWVVTFSTGVPLLKKDKQGLNPSSNCNF
ncbi:histidine phosphatase family protein [Pedobacter sp. KBW06]|uniref:histidine phosphatase family protein n=1 Tax=Pedobacter sp. KBW06 TaxID=2153359 RepID=UPI000F59E205|nr:histidine phosphatase family protein [Pedobacter sp. KBW06]RQO64351.1 histidine phosphatase family protein [Pedobacter sp. KBW06]